MRNVLIIGAKPDSLGDEIHRVAKLSDALDPMTAGISGEDFQLNLSNETAINNVLHETKPDIIVCTVGINQSVMPINQEHNGYMFWIDTLQDQMRVNAMMPLRLLHRAVLMGADRNLESVVFISSNSAHIARRNSVGYCASKAALSMGIRCAARELAGRPLVWAYEFGLLKGTPMTQATEATFGPAQTRMVGAPEGLETHDAAVQVIKDVTEPWMGLNGATLRLDAGEQ